MLFDALAAAVAARLREFTPQEFALTAWAFARASFAVPRIWFPTAREAGEEPGMGLGM